MRKNKEDNLTCWRVRGFLQLELWVVEAEQMTRKTKSPDPLFHARTITLCPPRKIHHECLPKSRIYKLSCLPTLPPNKEGSNNSRAKNWPTEIAFIYFISINDQSKIFFSFWSPNKMILLCIISNMLWLDVTPSFCNNHNRKYDPSKQRYPMNIINKREKWFFILVSNLSKLSQKKGRYKIFKTNKTSFPKNSPWIAKSH